MIVRVERYSVETYDINVGDSEQFVSDAETIIKNYAKSPDRVQEWTEYHTPCNVCGDWHISHPEGDSNDA